MRALSRAPLVLAIALLATALLARMAHFTWTEMPPVLDRLIGFVMHAQLILYMNTARHARGLLLIGVLLLAAALLLPRWCLDGDGGRRRFRNWFRTSSWVLLALGNVALDASPFVAASGFLTLPVGVMGGKLRRGADSRIRWWPTILLIGTLAGAAGFFAKSNLDVVAVAVWGVLLAGARVARIAAFDVTTGLVAALGALQLSATHAPLLWGGGGGQALGPDYAYSFCETPRGDRVLAAVPACGGGSELLDCIRGRVVEYDAGTGQELARFEPFSREFYGRALHLLCLEDRIQLGMAQTVIHGRFRRESVIELKLAGKGYRRTSGDLAGGAVGHRIAFDPRTDSVFYVSEWSGIIHRWNRVTDEWRTDAGRFLVADQAGVSAEQQLRHGAARFLFDVPMSLQTEIDAVHAARGTVFFAEWLSGSRIFEVDTKTFDLRRVYDPHNGANHSLAVDTDLDRLIVSGLWGLEVFDLASGRLVARRRVGVGPRLPLIDPLHDLVYLPTTYGGGIWVLDRRSYEVLGRVDVGNGGRNGLITSDSSMLYAGSARAHYRWDTASLAARVGR